MEIDDFRGEVFARRFFDFFRDLSRGTLAFETQFGRPLPDMVSKVSEPCETSLKKSKKHHARASPGLKNGDPHTKIAKNKSIPGSRGSSGSTGSGPGLLLGTSRPHAPGVRMT